jgi:hypothetical protein
VNHRDRQRVAGKTALAGLGVWLVGTLAIPFAPSCLYGGDADWVVLTAGSWACVNNRSVLYVVAGAGFLLALVAGSVAVATSLYRRLATPA